MIIQHNMPALNSLGRLNANVANTNKASEKLSTGYRINRAADDAAGLAVSEKMRSQLRGLNRASRNCQDGINLVQTFDAALGESHSIIQRAKELAAEAANGIYDNPTDRAAIELEYKQLCNELNNIADTDFNGLCMLNGGSMATAGPNGMYWAESTNLKWKSGSIVNQTDDPDFDMIIKKLPALDTLTMITEDEKAALSELNGVNVGVDLDNGTPVFKFNEPVPKHLSIKTEGVKGIISMNVSGISTDVAEITLPNTKISFKSTGKGAWVTSSSTVRYNMPDSLSNPGTKLSDTKGSDPSTAGLDQKTNAEALRREYHDWLKSIPDSSAVQFQVTDDRKHFKIIKGADTLRIKNSSGNLTNCDDKTEYDIGSELFTTTNNKNGNTAGKDYEWKNWSFTVSWAPDSVMPGGKISLSSSGCTDSSPSIYLYGTKPSDKPYTPYFYMSLFSMSSSCQASGTNPGDDTNHGFWLNHGGYSFTFTYDVKGDKWTAVMNDGCGNSTTYNEGTAQFTQLAGKLHANTSSVRDTIKAAHALGYFKPDAYSNYPQSSWPRANRSSYSFTLSIRQPSASYSSATAWYAGYDNDSLKLDIYDPADPDKGGIDPDSAVKGTFTYVNPDKVNTVNEGYWVDQDNNVVDLETMGIHLPKAYSKTVLSSEDPEYRQPYIPLHDGLSISIDYTLKGPTGTAGATVHLWDGSDKITPMYNEGLADELRYSENLILQSNARSKDAVNFTFKYSSPGVGELKCDTNCSAKALGLSSQTLSTQEGANLALDSIDHALNKVSMVRACFGSIQNRLEKKVENIAVTHENITESESHIRDTDMALTMIDFTKSQIVRQAAQTMLAQSYTRPQQVLQLME